MKKTLALLSLAAACSVGTAVAQDINFHHDHVKRVLLISVDGMHAVDFANCANGISTANNGEPYCPAIAALGKTGVNYVAASTSKPSAEGSASGQQLHGACGRRSLRGHEGAGGDRGMHGRRADWSDFHQSG